MELRAFILSVPRQDVDTSVTIPCEAGAAESDCVQGCQFTCRLQHNCNFFSYDIAAEECGLFSELDFMAGCNVVVGQRWDDTPDLTVDTCLNMSSPGCRLKNTI